MAISSGVIWEVRSTATSGNVNGGGFKAGASGTDFSQQDTAQYALSGVTSAGAGDTVLSASAASNMVGNIARVVSGTNFTAGWYEIIAVSAGVSIQFDRAVTTGAGSSGVINIGGALSMASTLDDDAFESAVAGNIFYVKAGTYVLGEAVTISATGGTQNPIKIIGYNAIRGDDPTGSNRPLFNCGGNPFSMAANWEVYNMRFTGTGTSTLSVGTSGKAVNVQAINTSATADRIGIGTGTGAFILNCEAVSYRGQALNAGSGISIIAKGCYLHDSKHGVRVTTGALVLEDCIISNNVTGAIDINGVNTNTIIDNCTLYGAENKLGVGLNMITGVTNVRLINSIIYGFTTGVVHADTQSVGYDDYNNYYNNTADVSAAGQWQKGENDFALDPVFSNVTQRTGSTAATGASNTLTQTGATFQTWGVQAGDYIYISAGTGVTAGKYGILSVDSETQITVDITLSANATTDKVWQITSGTSFNVGTNMKALGFPGQFPGSGNTIGYTDLGAVQRQEAGGSGGASASVFVY